MVPDPHTLAYLLKCASLSNSEPNKHMPGFLTTTRAPLIAALVLTGGCATLPEDFERPVSYTYTDTDDTLLGQVRADEKASHPAKSGFYLLPNGVDAFVARALLAHAAERSIDAQYYLFHGDLTGRLLVDQLVKAADRGVRVRLLVDDMDLGGRDLGVSILDAHQNIEVRVFNPFSRDTARASQLVTRFGSVTRRMHNKSYTVDNQATIIGGRNIGDAYFGADPALAFGDLDVLAIGPVVAQVSSSFDDYWNSELAYPISVLVNRPPTTEEIRRGHEALDEYVAQQADSDYLAALRNSGLAETIRNKGVTYDWGEAQVVYDAPEKVLLDRDEVDAHLASDLGPLIRQVREELIIYSPYFVPGKGGVKFFETLIDQGVRVRVLTNSLASTDVGVVHAGYAKYRRRLLRAGVELYEVNKKLSRAQRNNTKSIFGSSTASLHAKSFVLDREKVFIGSLNFDPRSVYENTEIGLVLTSSEIATSMAEQFDQKIDAVAFRLELETDDRGVERIVWHGVEDGQPVTSYVDPHTGFWRRFGISLLSVLPIESQL